MVRFETKKKIFIQAENVFCNEKSAVLFFISKNLNGIALTSLTDSDVLVDDFCTFCAAPVSDTSIFFCVLQRLNFIIEKTTNLHLSYVLYVKSTCLLRRS